MPISKEDERKLAELEATLIREQSFKDKERTLLPTRKRNMDAEAADKKKWKPQVDQLKIALLAEQYGLGQFLKNLAQLSKGQHKKVEKQLAIIEAKTAEHLIPFSIAMNGSDPKLKKSALNNFQKEIDSVFETVLIHEAVAKHKNPIVKLWNEFKSWINDKANIDLLKIAKTGRQECIISQQTQFKEVIQGLKKEVADQSIEQRDDEQHRFT